jgi:hypothetical protein
MADTRRRIGPIGTGTRLLVGLGLLYLAFFDGTSWGITWYDLALGFGVLPGVTLATGLAARRRGSGPIRFTGSAGLTLNCLVIVALAVDPYTAGGAALFYGTALVVAAWRAQPGCEVTVLSNLILDRDDQIGCPAFSPIDEAERRMMQRKAPTPSAREPLATDARC